MDSTATMLDVNGYVHIKNVFTRRSIDILRNFIIGIDFHNTMQYDIVEQSVYEKNISNGIQYVLKFKQNDIELSTTFGDIIEGSNMHADSLKRDVFELVPETVKHVERRLILQSCDSDRLYYRIFNEERTIFHRDVIMKTSNYIHNLIDTNKAMYSYINKCTLITARVFFNRPGCLTQEIHIDDSLETLVVIIPFTDFKKNSGTTIVYDNHIVDEQMKHKTIGHFNELSAERKEKFGMASYKPELNIGDVLIYKSTNYHHGTENCSNEDRVFLHLSYQKPSTNTFKD